MRREHFERVEHISEPVYSMLPGEPPLENDVLYIVDGPQYVEYNCPCGCGNVVMIPYYKPQEAKKEWGWTMREEAGRVTLSPSVYSTSWPCRSHYFIRENKIL